MKKKTPIISAVVIAAAVALSGCSAGGSMPGMNHGNAGMSSGSAPIAAGDHSGDDTAFAQMMIPHHAQAVEMSDMLLKKKNIPTSVAALATRIKAAQGPEIETLTGWLKSWDEPSTMPANHSMSGMTGTAGDTKKLETAQGSEAAKLFLTQMIAHHQGTVMMAKTEESAGKNAEAVALSKKIVSAQESEVQEMKDLLATL